MVFLRCALSLSALFHMARGHLRRDSNESRQYASLRAGNGTNEDYREINRSNYTSENKRRVPVNSSTSFRSSNDSSSEFLAPCRSDCEETENYKHVPNLGTFQEEWNSLYLSDKESWTKEFLNRRVRLVLGVFSTPEMKGYEEVIRNTWWKHPGLCMVTDGPSENCSVYTTFVHGNGADSATRDVFKLNVTESVNDGKSFAWFRHASEDFTWATYIGKMDLDTYPNMTKLAESLDTDTQCESYVGVSVTYDSCRRGKLLTVDGRKLYCPPKACGHPLHGNFLDYEGGKDCWSYMQGGLYIISQNLVRGATAPGTFWSQNIKGHEDMVTGKGISMYARSKNVCVNTWNPKAWKHNIAGLPARRRRRHRSKVKKQKADTALAVLDRDQGATAYLVGLKDRHGVGFDAANRPRSKTSKTAWKR